MYDVNFTSHEEQRRRDERDDRAQKLLPSFAEGTPKRDEFDQLRRDAWLGDAYAIDELERLLRKLLPMI